MDPGATQVLIPGLILQPLVENAVQHAIASRPEGGLVSIRVKNENEMVRITVEDDGPGLPDEVRDRLGGFMAVAALAGIERAVEAGTAGAGGGLGNVQKRLALIYRGAARMTFTGGESGGSVIEIEVPKK